MDKINGSLVLEKNIEPTQPPEARSSIWGPKETEKGNCFRKSFSWDAGKQSNETPKGILDFVVWKPATH